MTRNILFNISCTIVSSVSATDVDNNFNNTVSSNIDVNYLNSGDLSIGNAEMKQDIKLENNSMVKENDNIIKENNSTVKNDKTIFNIVKILTKI